MDKTADFKIEDDYVLLDTDTSDETLPAKEEEEEVVIKPEEGEQGVRVVEHAAPPSAAVPFVTKKTYSLWITNLSRKTNASHLKTLFGEVTKSIAIKILATKAKEHLGFATFRSPQLAMLCMKTFNGTVLQDKKIEITTSKPFGKERKVVMPEDAWKLRVEKLEQKCKSLEHRLNASQSKSHDLSVRLKTMEKRVTNFSLELRTDRHKLDRMQQEFNRKDQLRQKRKEEDRLKFCKDINEMKKVQVDLKKQIKDLEEGRKRRGPSPPRVAPKEERADNKKKRDNSVRESAVPQPSTSARQNNNGPGSSNGPACRHHQDRWDFAGPSGYYQHPPPFAGCPALTYPRPYRASYPPTPTFPHRKY